MTADQIKASWRLNVRAHFVTAQAAMAVMQPQDSGSIIINASNSGVQFDREMIAYATTKPAAIAMAKQIVIDYGRYNIRCNALCQGFIDTTFNAGFEQQMGSRVSLENYVERAIPMARFGTAAQIADGIVFLASDRSAFMTGHTLIMTERNRFGRTDIQPQPTCPPMSANPWIKPVLVGKTRLGLSPSESRLATRQRRQLADTICFTSFCKGQGRFMPS